MPRIFDSFRSQTGRGFLLGRGYAFALRSVVRSWVYVRASGLRLLEKERFVFQGRVHNATLRGDLLSQQAMIGLNGPHRNETHPPEG